MRVGPKEFPDRNVPDELEMYWMYFVEASAKEVWKVTMDGKCMRWTWGMIRL